MRSVEPPKISPLPEENNLTLPAEEGLDLLCHRVSGFSTDTYWDYFLALEDNPQPY